MTASPHDVLGRTIKAERVRKGLTQAGLSERSGVAVWRIRSFEQGRSQPHAQEIVALATNLGCTTDQLLMSGALVGECS